MRKLHDDLATVRITSLWCLPTYTPFDIPEFFIVEPYRACLPEMHRLMLVVSPDLANFPLLLLRIGAPRNSFFANNQGGILVIAAVRFLLAGMFPVCLQAAFASHFTDVYLP